MIIFEKTLVITHVFRFQLPSPSSRTHHECDFYEKRPKDLTLAITLTQSILNAQWIATALPFLVWLSQVYFKILRFLVRWLIIWLAVYSKFLNEKASEKRAQGQLQGHAHFKVKPRNECVRNTCC